MGMWRYADRGLMRDCLEEEVERRIRRAAMAEREKR